MKSSQELRVHLHQIIKATPAQVWTYLGTEQGMKEWIGMKEYRPEIGAPILIDTHHNGTHYHMTGEVIVYDAPREIAFTWNEQEVGKDPWPASTTVRIVLEAVDQGTLVHLIHEGFEALGEPTASEQHAGYEQGWAILNDLDKLAARVEQEVHT